MNNKSGRGWKWGRWWRLSLSWTGGMEFVAADRHARGNRLINKSTGRFRPRDLSTGEKSDNLSAGMGFFVGGNGKKGKYGTINNSLDARQFVRPETDSVLFSRSTFSSLRSWTGKGSDLFGSFLKPSNPYYPIVLSLLLHIILQL